MLTIKCRLPVNSTRLLVFTSLIKENEQKRHSSLTIKTLNPLVKEVEYAVRGKNTFFFHYTLFITGPIVIRAGEIEKQLKVNIILFK